MVSNRNPFEQGNSRVVDRFYGGNPDVVWSGSNAELSNAGLWQRRPGFTPWTTTTLPSAALNFYSYRDLTGTLHVLADTATAVYVITPTSATELWTKATGASVTQFLAVGSQLYACDGKTNHRWDGTTVYNDGITAPASAPTLSYSPAGAAWQASTVYPLGQPIVEGGVYQRVTTPGTSGATAPTWNSTVGGTTTDGTVTWTNVGALGGTWQPGTKYGAGVIVTDSNGNFQEALAPGGTSGSAAPSWALGDGQQTADNNLIWQNIGADAHHGVFEQFGAYYTFCYVNSATGHYSTAAPLSAYTGPQADEEITVSGAYSTDPQANQVAIFRSPDGSATPMLIQTIANNTAGGTWTWTDTLLDSALNPLIVAPQAHANDPAPAAQYEAFYCGCRWVASGNNVYFSGGPLTVVGDGIEAFPPANVFTFPGTVVALQESPSGLLVYLTDRIYLIAGTNAVNFYVSLMLGNLGLGNANALCFETGTPVLFSNDARFLALANGPQDIGLPIADLLGTISPSAASITAHSAGSNDRALWVCDGSTTLYRLNPQQQPEFGPAWSTPYTPTGGVTIVRSVETSPGVRQLLIGQSTGAILYRDLGVYTDNGTAYSANLVLGSIVLAPPGSMGWIEAVVVESEAGVTAPTVSLLLDEISGTFVPMGAAVPDPPNRPASTSIQALRYYLAAATTPQTCRTLMLKLDLGTQANASSVYSISVVGADATGD